MLKIILILSLSLAISSAQLIQNGQCDPNIQLQSDFRVTDVSVFHLGTYNLTSRFIPNGVVKVSQVI